MLAKINTEKTTQNQAVLSRKLNDGRLGSHSAAKSGHRNHKDQKLITNILLQRSYPNFCYFQTDKNANDEEYIRDVSHEAGTIPKIITFNVGGRQFQILESTLTRRKGTLLCKFAEADESERKKIADFFSEYDESYFFDRNPEYFDCILDYFRTGFICTPANVCEKRFFRELRFWQIPIHISLPLCCNDEGQDFENAEKFDDVDKLEANHCAGKLRGNETKTDAEEEDEFKNVRFSEQRRMLWRCLDDPMSSKPAHVISFFSLLFIFLSVLGLIVSSLPQCQDEKGNALPFLVHLEQVCVAWFTLEYLSRFLIYPYRCRFVRVPLNIIDLLSIIPFYFELILGFCGIMPEQLETVKGALLGMRLLRVIRVARVLKLARYSSSMQSFGSGLKSSAPEFAILTISMSVSILLFSTTIYYVEKGEENSPFITIPAAFWWCIVTMTTVGYGDMVPSTDLGKLVAAFATLSGVVVLAYPITLIVGKFNSTPGNPTEQARNPTAIRATMV